MGTQDAKRALIIAGVGWGRLLQWAVERELAEGHLLPLPATALGPQGVAQMQTYLAWRRPALGAAATALRGLLHRLAETASQGRPNGQATKVRRKAT